MGNLNKSKSTKGGRKRSSQSVSNVEEKCLICNATIRIIREEAKKTVVEEIGISTSEEQTPADDLMKNLCSIFYLPFKLKDDGEKSTDGTEGGRGPLRVDYDGTAGTEETNFVLLEPCKTTSPCCSICQAFLEEFFRYEKQINDLIRQMSRLKQRIGSLMVETFPATPAFVNNYTLKKRIYEAWFPKVHDPPTVPIYQLHYKFMNDGEVPVPLPSAISASLSSFKENPTEPCSPVSPVDQIILNPSLSTKSDQPHEWDVEFEDTIAMELCSPVPSPLAKTDSETSENIDNEGAEIQETTTTVLVDDAVDSTKLSANSKTAPVEDCIKRSEQDGGNGIADETKPRRDGKSKSFICPNCNKSLTTRKGYLIHVRGHTGEKPYSCKHCEMKFRDTKQKRKHERFTCKLRPELQSSEDEIEDPEPSLTTNFEEQNERGETTPAVRSKTEVRIKNYTCPHCEVGQHDTMLNLKAHIKEKHPGENQFKCGWCNKTLMDNSNILKHERYTCKFRPGYQPEDDREDPHPTSKKKSQLNRIKEKAAKEKLDKRIQSGIKIYECPHCEVQHDKIGTLKTHIIESHPGQHPFICGWCGKSFADQSYVVKHEKIHVEPEHQCEICGQQFHFVRTLYTHRIFVHEKRPHDKKKKVIPTKCKICGKPCNSSRLAKKHEITHNPNGVHERLFQYKCPECPKHLGCSSKIALSRHYKRTHPDLPIPKDLIRPRKMFPCPDCPTEKNITFFDEASVTRHIKIYHTGRNPPPYLKHGYKKRQNNVASRKLGQKKKTLKHFEIDSSDSGTENSDGTTSESDGVKERTKSNRTNQIGISGKMKTRQDSIVESTPSAAPQGSFQRHQNPSNSSESESHDSDEYTDNVLCRTGKKMKQKSSVNSKANSNPFELKRLRIHLTRIDEVDNVLAEDILVKEEISVVQMEEEEVEEVTEIISPSFTISNVYSLAE